MANSPQYEAVLKELETLTDTLDLKANEKAKQKLLLKFQIEGWLGATADPSAADLIRLALNRIKNDVNQYKVFIDMLRGITELKAIANKITGIWISSPW